MTKFKFRLATLLKLREAARDERRGQLAQAYQADEIIAELGPMLGVTTSTGSARQDAEAAIEAVRRFTSTLRELTGLPITLQQAGVQEEQLPEIAKITINEGTTIMNPEEITLEDMVAILRKAYGKMSDQG